MTIRDILQILNARLVCGEDCLDHSVRSACGSDLMSDVLAYVKDQSVLLSGLCNPQVIRTAEMMDIACVVFVRHKHPTEEMIDLALASHIALLTTDLSMFTACGLLYEDGLRGGADCERLS